MKWYKRITNIKLKYKLALIYIIAGFIPVIILLSVTNFQIRKILLDKESENINSYMNQATASMDNQITIYNNLSNYISFSESISQIVSYDYKSDLEMYTQLIKVLDPMLSSFRYFHSAVNQVTIYADNNEIWHDKTLAPLSDIDTEYWFNQVIKGSANNYWYVQPENKQVFAVKRMPSLEKYGIKGILYVNVDYASVFESFDKTFIENSGLFITDQNGNLIYQNNEFSDEYEDFTLTYEQMKEQQQTSNSKYTIMTKVSDETGWTIYYYKPTSLIITSMEPLIVILIVAGVLCITASAASIISTSKFITKRINALLKNMKEVENGNMVINIEDKGERDEIGMLISGFKNMIEQLNNLFNEVYEGKIKQKEYEMRALQAQINPHFLYNSLSLINWKAIEAGEQDISNITLALSTFYRTSLNKGKNLMSIEDEISNMKSYVLIQLVMHDYDFDVVYDIDDKILHYSTLNLILQPIIENAIDHGIDLMTERRGVITIKGYEENGNVVMTVEDNGVGMEEDKANEILTAESKGYGVRNVNERIKLYYGDEYELQILSHIDVGTRVKITFPIQY